MRLDKTHLFTLAGVLVLAGTLAAPSVVAQETLTITSFDDGNDFWFEVEGYDGENPTIVLLPETEYTITLEGAEGNEQDHNVKFGFGDEPESDYVQTADESTTLTITTPAESAYGYDYWCVPHKAAGMEGGVVASEDDLGGDEENGTPGFGAVAALAALGAGLALVQRRGD